MKKRISTGLLALLVLMFAVGLNPANAGAIGGAKRKTDVVLTNHTDVYQITFRKGKKAIVAVSGDGDFDLYVYDAKGNLIASDTTKDETSACTWTPRRTASYTIKIVNRDEEDIEYALGTN